MTHISFDVKDLAISNWEYCVNCSQTVQTQHQLGPLLIIQQYNVGEDSMFKVLSNFRFEG